VSYRDDQEAMLARLDALEHSRETHDRELATRDDALVAARSRIDELEHEVSRLQRELVDREASIRDLQRRRGMAVEEPTTTKPGEDRHATADRCLAEGIARYQAGDREGAHVKFRTGLTFVPDHTELLRALRRYN